MLSTTIKSGWHIAKRRSAVPVDSSWRTRARLDRQQQTGWGQADALALDAGFDWSTVPAADTSNDLPWQQAQMASAVPVTTDWQSTTAQDAGLNLAWDKSIKPRDTLRLRLIYVPKPQAQDSNAAVRFNRVNEFRNRSTQALDLYVPSGRLAFEIGGARYTPRNVPGVYFDFRYEPTPQAITPVDSSARDTWGAALQLNQALRLPWGKGRATDPSITVPYPDYDGPVIVIEPAPEPEIQDTYMIVNSVSVVVLPDRVPLDFSNLKLALDIDAFSWSMSFDLTGQTSLNLIKPDAAGQKEVEVEINGWRWRMIVERYRRTLAFPSERYSVTGASRTQFLAAPYAPKRSAVNAVEINARQAAEDQLLYTGFTLEWDAVQENPVDWAIPAGALSYQDQTPMEIIARIASAAGAVVRPSTDSDELTVLPRYREAVWNWGTAIVDRILPMDIVTAVEGEWSPQPTWNSCYVSGTNFGVAVDVRRTGTAGDNPAPDVYDDLITDTNVARARGICELSKGGDIEIVGLNLPLFPPESLSGPGLVLPAHLCEVRETEPWRGLVLSCEISATGTGASKVVQTLRVERHTGVQ